jgi:hypothetical protein
VRTIEPVIILSPADPAAAIPPRLTCRRRARPVANVSGRRLIHWKTHLYDKYEFTGECWNALVKMSQKGPFGLIHVKRAAYAS